MEKPQLLCEIDFKMQLTKLINEYSKRVPAMHMINALEEFKSNLQIISDRQIEEIKNHYEQSLQKEWEEKGDEKNE